MLREEVTKLSEAEAKRKLLEVIDDTYMLVTWPWSQEYMEEPWFEEEAIFCGGSEEQTGSSAYFIPTKYKL